MRLDLILTTGPILDIGGMGAFIGAHFLKKKVFGLLAPSKQMSFLTISNEHFSKTQGTRFGVILTPNRGQA